jgi:hypothetical protein
MQATSATPAISAVVVYFSSMGEFLKVNQSCYNAAYAVLYEEARRNHF